MQFPMYHAWVTAMMFGGVVGFVMLPVAKNIFSKGMALAKLEDLAKVFALLYFVYSVFGGNLFATTSVKLKVQVPSKTITAHASELLVTMEIERGSNWLAEIATVGISQAWLAGPCRDSVLIKPPDGPAQCVQWYGTRLPSRARSLTRLAPEEKTSVSFLMPRRSSVSDVYLTAVVVSYSIWWPVPSVSFASTPVLSREDAVSESGAPKCGEEAE